MQAKEAASRLGITQRMLRHYEKEGLMDVARSHNGYRHYTERDLRRAARIRNLISSGFSTREVQAMQACLSDEGDDQCEGGIALYEEKLDHINQLMTDLAARRETVLARLADLKQAHS